MAPTNQDELKSEVRTALSLGYESSPINDEAATMANGIPKPRIILAITNIATAHIYQHISRVSKSGGHTVLRGGLEDGANNHDNGTEDNTHSSSVMVVYHWNERERKNTTQRV